jgi:hypothetical protein
MQTSKENLLNFTTLCLWLITSLTMAAYAFLVFGQDFRGYYAAGRVLLEGGNPYDYAQVARVLVEVTGRAGNNPFYYPLWFGWSVAPLSLLPFQAAGALWMLINLALWIVGLIRLQQLLDFPQKGWRGWSWNLLATFLFAWTTWKFEQTGILLFVIAVEILISYKRQQWNRMGIFLALALIKPNVMLLPVIALGLWLIRNQNWRPVIVAGIVLTALVLVTTILTPGWYQPFLQPNFGQGLTEVLDGPDQVTGTRLNTTLLDWLKWFSIPLAARSLIYGCTVLGGLWILGQQIWKSTSILDVTVTALLVSFAVTPYALQYDSPPLTIVLYAALAASRHVKSKWTSTLILIFITSVLVWERPISDGYWIVIGLILLTIWAFRNSKLISPPADWNIRA